MTVITQAQITLYDVFDGEKGEKGEQGVSGASTYTWIKYADDNLGTGMSDLPEGKRFLGIAYNKTSQQESNVAKDYSWSSLYDDKIADELKNYVQSRGENLITNGTGLLGNNTNFSNFEFDGANVFAGGGSFMTTKQNTTLLNDEFIPVDATKKYRISMMAKSSLGKKLHYLGVQSFDIDKNVIVPYNFYGSKFKAVELTKPLKKGDMEIHVSDVSEFVDKNVDNDHTHSIVMWGYKNSFGYEYPVGTYSRFNQTASWKNGAIDRVNKVITLSKPFSVVNPYSTDGSFPIGHKVSPTQSGSNYQYTVLSNKVIPTEWTYFEGSISGNGIGDKFFPHGISFVRVMFMINRTATNVANETVWFSSVSLTDVTSSMSFTWIKYADNDKGLNMSDSPVGKNYMGIAYNKPTEVVSSNPSDYTWG